MRSSRIALALCGGLFLTPAPVDAGQAQGAPGRSSAARAAKTLPSKTPTKLRGPHDLIQSQRANLPFSSPSAAVTAHDRPAFSPLAHRASYDAVPFAPNPLVSAPYRATAEYEFLYTPALMAASPPPITNYRYRADNGYLLRPMPAYQVAAWSYQWKRSAANRTAIRALQDRPRGNAPAASRKPGQKIDDALGARAMLPRDEKAVWQPSAAMNDLQLGTIVRSQ